VTVATAPLPPALAALERMREAWEKAGRPGPGCRQLTLPGLPAPAASDADRVWRCGQ
jgi:hypothetical protein